MAFSLARALAVRFALTMAVALVAIALWAGAGVDKALHEQLDRSLSSTYELQSDALTRQAELSPLPGEDRRLIERINRLVVGRDSSGRIVQANTGLARDLPLDSGAFRRALGSGRVVVDAKLVSTTAPEYTQPGNDSSSWRRRSGSPLESFSPWIGRDASTSTGTAPPAFGGKWYASTGT